MLSPKQRNSTVPFVAFAAIPFAGIAPDKLGPHQLGGLQIQGIDILNPQDTALYSPSGALSDADDANNTEIDITDFTVTVDTPPPLLQD